MNTINTFIKTSTLNKVIVSICVVYVAVSVIRAVKGEA